MMSMCACLCVGRSPACAAAAVARETLGHPKAADTDRSFVGCDGIAALLCIHNAGSITLKYGATEF